MEAVEQLKSWFNEVASAQLRCSFAEGFLGLLSFASARYWIKFVQTA